MATTDPLSLADMWVFEPEQFDAPFAVPDIGGVSAGGMSSFVQFIFGPGRTLVVTTSGPSSVRAWLDDLASAEGVTTSQPFETKVGGTAAISVDVEISSENTADSCGYACLVLFGYTWGAERKEGGTARRLLLLDVYGETVAIIANASSPTFDEGWGDVENFLQNLVWLEPVASTTAAADAAPPELQGIWATDISGEHITLSLSGTRSEVHFENGRTYNGRTSVNGNEIRFTFDILCQGVGLYLWSVDGETLTFTANGPADSCPERRWMRNAFDGITYTRSG